MALPRLPVRIGARGVPAFGGARGLGRVASTSPVAPALLPFSDDFNRANQTPPGTSTSGHVWGLFTGATGLSVSSNRLGKTAGGGALQGSAVDVGFTNGVLTCTLPVVSGSALYVVLRGVDDANYLRIDQLGRLTDVVAGAPFTRATMANEDLGSGDVLEITMATASVTVRRNGGLEINGATVTSLTGTLFGMVALGTTDRMDDLSVVPA